MDMYINSHHKYIMKFLRWIFVVYRKVIFVNNRLSSNVAYDDKSSGYTSELPNEGLYVLLKALPPVCMKYTA